MSRLGSEVITVVHAELVTSSRDGTQYRDWEHATRTPYEGCMVEPFLMSNKLVKEDNQSREYAQEFLRMWLPADAVVEYYDRLEWNGQDCEAFGEAQLWRTRRGKDHHVQLVALLRRG